MKNTSPDSTDSLLLPDSVINTLPPKPVNSTLQLVSGYNDSFPLQPTNVPSFLGKNLSFFKIVTRKVLW